MDDTDDAILRETLELGEYEATALDGLFRLGRTTAPNLAEATGIPKARIYGILEDLGNAGFVKIIPSRPKEFEPKAPDAVLEQAVENQRQEFEQFRTQIDEVRKDFVEYYEPLLSNAEDEIETSDELFYVVDVGEPSERQTRNIYRDASTEIRIMTKSYEYFESVEPALQDALAADVSVQILFARPDHLSNANAEIQAEILDVIDSSYPEVEYRFSNQPLPWRGTIADPQRDDGTAIFLVGETDIPLHMRQASITEDESFVEGMDRYFSLTWDHESVQTLD